MTPAQLAVSDQNQAIAREQAARLLRGWAQHDYEFHQNGDCCTDRGAMPRDVAGEIWANDKQAQFFLVIELMRRLRRQGSKAEVRPVFDRHVPPGADQ